jgi:hypothetical protein
MYDHSEAEKLINEIKHYSEDVKPLVKTKILQLAKIYEEAIQEKNNIVITKIKNIKGRHTNEEPNIKDISLLINKLREDNFKLISQTWIYKILPEKYRHTYKKDEVKLDEISDKELYVMKDDLIRRIKDMERGPSQDIKVKETKEDIERYNFECFVAGELAKLAIKMEKDHKEKHDPKICTKISKHVKSARDSRFATTQMEYEALIVACNSTTSLAHVVEGEFGFKQRWEIEEDEKNCRNCRDRIECVSSKCKCPCHDVVKPMTTKGLKFAINSNKALKELDDRMKQIMNEDWSDICPFAKIVLKNPKINRYMKNNSKKKIIASHIEKDDCVQCESFLEDNPNFFDTGK